MSDKEFPSCAYDVCAEFDCEETMALALIATRNELERTRKALEVAKNALNDVIGCEEYGIRFTAKNAKKRLDQITALEQKGK